MSHSDLFNPFYDSIISSHRPYILHIYLTIFWQCFTKKLSALLSVYGSLVTFITSNMKPD